MLKLKRVELQGFKSFYERTEMQFSGNGIAAIVGPNGCGKSNLSDAISWVLGEQSAKSLRGARMEDVIFAGTRDRKPLGMASVTLTLLPAPDPVSRHPVLQAATNGLHQDNGTGPAAQPPASEQPANGKVTDGRGEITITRRLYRSGESEYLINGRTARLRDIQDLFLGTGLGPESYAIIEQGRIGQILSNRPQDRRGVIEEAAGITKFRTRKRLAEAKLESAKSNLARVFDILEEVTRQVNSLKRQAAKTKRYAELNAEARHCLTHVLGARIDRTERDVAQTVIDLNLASAGLESLQGAIAERERERTSAAGELRGLEQRLTAVRSRVAEEQLAAERVRGRIEAQTRQAEQLAERLAADAREGEQLQTQREHTAREADRQHSQTADIEAALRAAQQALDTQSQARAELQRQVSVRQQRAEQMRYELMQQVHERAALQNRITQHETRLAAAEQDRTRAESQSRQAADDLNHLEIARKRISEELASRQLSLTSLADERQVVDRELSEKRARGLETRRESERLQTEYSRVKARRDSLLEILSHHAYTSGTVKRLFEAVEGGRAPGFAVSGALADFLEVRPDYERAAEEFLHDELEFVVVKDRESAERGIDFVRAGMEGRATFLVESGASHAGIEDEDVSRAHIEAEEGVIAPLDSVVRFSGSFLSAAAALVPRLARTFLARDRQAARDLAGRYPHHYFLTADGVAYHGLATSGGKKTSTGPLALKRELRELEAVERSRAAELAAARQSLASLDADVRDLTERSSRLQAEQQGQERDAIALDQESRRLAEESQRVKARLSQARLELERIGRDRADLETALGQDRAALEQNEAARQRSEMGLESALADLRAGEQEADRVAEAHAASRAAVASLEERYRASQAAGLRLEEKLSELAGRAQTVADDAAAVSDQRLQLLGDSESLETKRVLLQQQVETLERESAELDAAHSAEIARLNEWELRLSELRASAQQSQERRSELQVAFARLESETQHLAEMCRKELQLTPAEVATAVAGSPAESGSDMETRHAALRERIDALGPINPQALEEFEEAQQRQEFLQAQRSDLLDSIRDIERAIGEIDHESRRRFEEAFAAINRNFDEIFQTLFGGGSAHMRLTNEEHADESGIDLIASPPGKRLQSVLLLSGGEKSLTAMALLMAIFNYTPSPFCVLDEVDAPLDEPNTERLTRLLRGMAEQTQFIVITHSKRTMEAAQALYGVTMQEPGISKLVSVKFRSAGEPAALPAPTSARALTSTVTR